MQTIPSTELGERSLPPQPASHPGEVEGGNSAADFLQIESIVLNLDASLRPPR